jgi:hypothetical protein
MPPSTQRRNTAYLNRQNPRMGQPDRDTGWPGTLTWTGLAIDLWGSLKQRFRPDELGVAYLDELLALIAPLERRVRPSSSSFLICAF